VLGAADVGAPHLRERIWIVGVDPDNQQRGCMFCGYVFDRGLLGKYGCPNCEGEGLDSDSCGDRLQDSIETWAAERATSGPCDGSYSVWWQSEPDVGRVAHGVAARVHRLKCLGNGQVPQCAALAWRILSG
jgi:DNA (cytosine-5)-methyltransferase 1